MSTIVVSHKIRLKPTTQQELYFLQACGTARFAYNWALAEWTKQYKDGGKPSALALKKLFRHVAKSDYPWVYEVTKCSYEQAFNDLSKAFQMFFKKVTSYPTYKKKGRSKDSFYLSNDQFKLDGKRIRVPKLGWVRMREALLYEGKILSARISRSADQWHISINVEIPKPTDVNESQACVGIDLGINTYAYLSDGQYVLAPKPLRKLEKKLARLQRRHSRKVRGGKNRQKAAMKLARLHLRIANIRTDFLHKLTSGLVSRYKLIAIEDLNVKGMLRNHKLAKSIADASFSEFRRQLEYKSYWTNRLLKIVDRWFPSSKTCSQCGQVKDATPLNMRTYVCDCGNTIDRDLNAAINLLLIATGGLPGSYACGQTHLWDIVGNMNSVSSELAEAGTIEPIGSTLAVA